MDQRKTVAKPTAAKRKQLVAEAEQKRLQFGRSLRNLREAKIPYLDRAAEMPQELLDGCRLIQNRQRMIKLLPKGAIVAEIGTDRGEFAKFILDTSQPKELHVFEIDTKRIVPTNIADGVRNGTVFVHEGDSAVEIASMPNRFFDWIYIDGDHKYEGVKRDIAASAPKVKDGGYLVFNDYATWSPSSMSKCGVARAVNEFCIANGWEFVFLAFQSMMYNDVAIRRKIG